MESLWSSILLKEKRVQRQQMLQALVEFQFKAVNMHQSTTSIDVIQVVGVLNGIPSKIMGIGRVGKRRSNQNSLIKTKLNKTSKDK